MQAIVVIPTLGADARLGECLESLERQVFQSFSVIVVDNSGSGSAARWLPPGSRATLIRNASNVGFGAAINQGIRSTQTPYVAALNDDTQPEAGWLGALIEAMESAPGFGMAASRIVLAGAQTLDSAGMLIARDGSSRQRGHGEPPAAYARREEVLLPSGCAALYRRAMLEECGAFAEDFFLYCEDTDLGLRGQWAGYRCIYEPEAVVIHHYSASAGRASAAKARYVERNRLRLVVRNFPPAWLAASFAFSAARYFWHLLALLRGSGKAAEFRAAGGGAWRLPLFVLRAHVESIAALPRLLEQRAAIRRTRRCSPREFARLMQRHSISLREVASH